MSAHHAWAGLAFTSPAQLHGRVRDHLLPSRPRSVRAPSWLGSDILGALLSTELRRECGNGRCVCWRGPLFLLGSLLALVERATNTPLLLLQSCCHVCALQAPPWGPFLQTCVYRLKVGFCLLVNHFESARLHGPTSFPKAGVRVPLCWRPRSTPSTSVF